MDVGEPYVLRALDISLNGEQKEEYLKTDFIDLFQEDSYLRTDENRFFMRDGCLVFIAPSLPSFRGYTYVKSEISVDGGIVE